MTHQKNGKNNNSRTITDKQFSGFVFFFVALTALMMSSGLIGLSRANGATATLPNCTDPTGQNLPCMIVLSTLPPPSNAIQCQETTGQILSCSYATQTLSNGQQIVVITVYVPVNYVFSSPTIKVVIHKTETTTKTKIIHKVIKPSIPFHTEQYWQGYRIGILDGKVGVYDLGAACGHLIGKDHDHCSFGYRTAYVTYCLHSPHGCGDGPTTFPTSSETEGVTGGGGKTSCTDNCTTVTAGSMPLVLTPALATAINCNASPNDRSCQSPPQSQPVTQPQTENSPSATKTCPDGSQPDSTGKCPIQSTQNPNNSLEQTSKTKTKTCPDGSIIPKEDKCPTVQSSSSNPSNNNNPLPNNPPSNTAPNNNAQPSGNTPLSINGNTGSGENGGGSPPPQPSTLDNGNSNSGKWGSSSGSSSNGHNSDSDHDGGDSSGKSDSDDSKSSSSPNH